MKRSKKKNIIFAVASAKSVAFGHFVFISFSILFSCTDYFLFSCECPSVRLFFFLSFFSVDWSFVSLFHCHLNRMCFGWSIFFLLLRFRSLFVHRLLLALFNVSVCLDLESLFYPFLSRLQPSLVVGIRVRVCARVFCLVASMALGFSRCERRKKKNERKSKNTPKIVVTRQWILRPKVVNDDDENRKMCRDRWTIDEALPFPFRFLLFSFFLSVFHWYEWKWWKNTAKREE